MSDMRETLMQVARSVAQAHGYNGLSFRELAKMVGVKSASVHYHFPTKADLGAAIAQRYADDTAAALETLSQTQPDVESCLQQYIGIFRAALENENRMCMAGQMGAEYDDLPEEVKVGVMAFNNRNVAWLAELLLRAEPQSDVAARNAKALAIFAAINGAQLAARTRNNIAVYDQIIESYWASGLFPKNGS